MKNNQIYFTKKKNSFCLKCPAYFYNLDKIKQSIKELKKFFKFKDYLSYSTNLLLKISTKGNIDNLIIKLFSKINNYPDFTDVNLKNFRNSNKPLISCIILLTMNDLFVKNHLIPSIIKSSESYPIEIIVIYNGKSANLNYFKQFKVIKSSPFWVSKGYNIGAKYAKGKYLAIFHDDCIINDKNWIKKAISILDKKVYAVSPEFKGKTAKNVPLIIKKNKFLEIGGYDEHYFMGKEDTDFSANILLRNKKIRKIKLKSIHFGGMSTMILFSKYSSKFKFLFSYNILPKEILSQFLEYYFQLFKEKKIGIYLDEIYMSNKYKHKSLHRMKKRAVETLALPEYNNFLNINHRNLNFIIKKIKGAQ